MNRVSPTPGEEIIAGLRDSIAMSKGRVAPPLRVSARDMSIRLRPFVASKWHLIMEAIDNGRDKKVETGAEVQGTEKQ